VHGVPALAGEAPDKTCVKPGFGVGKT